jgi:chitinase
MCALAKRSTSAIVSLVIFAAACQEATAPEAIRVALEPGVLTTVRKPGPVTPPPDTQAPTTPVLSATEVGTTYISLAWSSTDVGPSIYYLIAINGGQDPNGGTSSTSRTYSLLEPATTYSFTARARDEAGNWSPISEPLKVTTKPRDVSDTHAPTAPTNVRADGYGDGSTELAVTWIASTDNVDAQSKIRYNVYLNGELSAITVGTTHSINYGVDGTNTITVIAVDAAGNESAAGTTTVVIQR